MNIEKSAYKKLELRTSILKAIAHPIRLAIIGFIKDKIRPSVKSIYEHLGVQQSVVSHHLGLLRNAGVLNRRVDHGKATYSINNSNRFVSELVKVTIMEP